MEWLRSIWAGKSNSQPQPQNTSKHGARRELHVAIAGLNERIEKVEEAQRDAKKLMLAGDRQRAARLLQRNSPKRLRELETQRENLQSQLRLLEDAEHARAMTSALRGANVATQNALRDVPNADDIGDLHDDLQESADAMREITEQLSTPILVGGMDDGDQEAEEMLAAWQQEHEEVEYERRARPLLDGLPAPPSTIPDTGGNSNNNDGNAAEQIKSEGALL